MSRPFHTNITSTSAVVPILVNDVNKFSTDFLGVAATNTTGAPYYLKFYWTGQQNISQSQLSAALVTVGCTIAPTLTVEVPTTGLVWAPGGPFLTNTGQLYLWATSTAADNANTSVGTSGDAITVVID